MFIVGLGNPGTKYRNTRHNFGFLAVLALAQKYGATPWKQKKDCLTSDGRIDSQTIKFVLPQTFMNNSGPALFNSFDKKIINELLVIHDELDLPFGEMKLQADRSAAGHNGVQSIIDAFGSKNFWRLRLGIGHTPKPADTEKFVLEKFTKDEQAQLPKIIKQAVVEIEKFITNNKTYLEFND